MEERSIQEIPELSVLTKNALLAAGIRNVKDLTLLNVGDLIRIPLIGKKGKNNVIQFCLKNDIKFNKQSYFTNERKRGI